MGNDTPAIFILCVVKEPRISQKSHLYKHPPFSGSLHHVSTQLYYFHANQNHLVWGIWVKPPPGMYKLKSTRINQHGSFCLNKKASSSIHGTVVLSCASLYPEFALLG